MQDYTYKRIFILEQEYTYKNFSVLWREHACNNIFTSSPTGLLRKKKNFNESFH